MSLNRIIETGVYAGNNGTQSISIGWQPAFVVIATTCTQGPPAGRAISFKLPTMTGDDYLACANNALFETTNGITLTSDGFDVGSDQKINQSGSDHHWIAVRDGPWLDYGTYTGVGVGSTTVVTGRQPGMVLIAQTTTTERMFIKNPNQAAGSSWFFESFGETDTTGDLTINSTGFTAESFADEDGETYQWVTLYDLPGSTRHWETGVYTGDGNTSQTITLGRQPKMVFVHSAGTADPAAWKSDSMSGTASAELDTGYDWLADGQVTLLSTGFQAHDSTPGSINVNGTAYRYWVGYV